VYASKYILPGINFLLFSQSFSFVNMFKQFFYICLLFTGFYTVTSGQSVRLINNADKLPVPYAHVVSNNFQTISDLDGNMSIPEKWRKDSVTISSIGFQTWKGLINDQTVVFLTPAVTELAPVIISDLSVQEQLFRIVEHMQTTVKEHSPATATYWRGVMEDQILKGMKVAMLSSHDEDWKTDSVLLFVECSVVDLESLTNEHTLFQQNQVYPPLACLKRDNASLWDYKIVESSIIDSEVYLLIEARFISPEKRVEHSFLIYVNQDRKQIERITYKYLWNEDYPIAIRSEYQKYSTLGGLSGTILFQESVPVYIEADYTLYICERKGMEECLEYRIYHEFFRNSEIVSPVNVSYYDWIKQGTDCQE
jgi:hypothetical protein